MTRTVEVSNEEELNNLITYIKTKKYPKEYDTSKRRNFRRKAEKFYFADSTLFYKDTTSTGRRAVFTFQTTLINIILKQEHESSGHLGMKKMISYINKKYYGIPSKAVELYVGSCEGCIKYNNLSTVENIIINRITKKYDRYMMDCIDLRKYSDDNDGYCWILNVIDTFTKYLWSFKLKDKSAVTIKNCLQYIFDNFGDPLEIQSDNGKEFKNSLLREFLLGRNIKIIHGRPRNPKAQGQVERVNQTIKRRLSKSLEGSNIKKWIEYLDSVVLAYNRSPHNATGQCPFYLFHKNSGFNAYDFSGMEVEEDVGGDVHCLTEVKNDYSEFSNTTWNFEEDKNIIFDDNVLIEIKKHPDSDIYPNLIEKVKTHFENYRNKIILNANKNFKRSNINEGDHVLLKLDFDNNNKTRKDAFKSFFEDDKFLILKVFSNDTVKIKNINSGTISIVHKKRIKKI